MFAGLLLFDPAYVSTWTWSSVHVSVSLCEDKSMVVQDLIYISSIDLRIAPKLFQVVCSIFPIAIRCALCSW